MSAWVIQSGGTRRRGTRADPVENGALCALARTFKNERIHEHVVGAFERPDGTQTMLDILVIVGHDKSAKLPTARAIVTVGHSATLPRRDDYRVAATAALNYTPICTLVLRAKLVGQRDMSSKTEARNTLTRFCWGILHRAHARPNFWVATWGKRSLRSKSEGLPPHMKYSILKDGWRVPAYKANDFRLKARAQEKFKRAHAWVFESIEKTRGGRESKI